jgi:hypothetical protein
MEKFIKIVLVILLFLCLLDMPYGFYQFVRLAGFFGFIYLAYNEYENRKEMEAIGHTDLKAKYSSILTFVILAILFQPFFKIALGRDLWTVVDVIVGVGLVVSIFIKQKTR